MADLKVNGCANWRFKLSNELYRQNRPRELGRFAPIIEHGPVFHKTSCFYYVASYERGRNEPKPMLMIGRPEWITRCVPQQNSVRSPCDKSFMNQARLWVIDQA